MNLDLSSEVLFENHPDPMWIYDLDSLRFLAVNDAAINRYGYARHEFLAMTSKEIRPEEEIPRLLKLVREVTAGLDQAGIWRHRLKSGELIYVDIRAHTMTYQGRNAALVSARDVTRLVELEQEKSILLAQEQESRRKAEAAAQHFQGLFEAVPGKFLVLHPENYVITAVSDAYLDATMTRRDDIKGRRLFDVFPDDPEEPDADGEHNLRASLERVKATGVADVMAVQRYPIPRPENAGGGFDERFWSPVNTPIKGPDGGIAYIIHRAEDVTDFVRGNSEGKISTQALTDLEDRDTYLGLDILLRSQELQAANNRLLEQDANLRTAQRLLGLGIWKLNIETDSLFWSDNVYTMYGLGQDAGAINFTTYVALVHPEDREGMLAHFADYAASPTPHLEFQHRVLRPDGRVIHVRGVGELTENQADRILTGVIQDISSDVEASARLAEATSLQRIAGHAARLGGWRVDLAAGIVQWSEETAAIHEVTDTHRHSLDEALQFYPPEYRDRIRDLFTACAEQGEPFDEVLQLLTGKGRRVWVRAIGEAEFDHGGRICAVRGAFQEINDLVETRERSEALSRRLHQTLENMSDAFFLLDETFCFAYLNHQAERLLQRNRDDLLGQHVWAEFPEAVKIEFKAQYEQAVDSGESVHFTSYFPPLETWFHVDAYPGAEGLAVYFQDVSKEIEREQQLRLLETAVARQNDILLITDADSIDNPDGPKIVYVNDAFTRITGYSREEAIGRTPRILQGANTQHAELARIRGALESWQPVRSELINYTKGGEEIWLEMDITSLIDDAGRHTHFVAVERNITGRKKAEQAASINEQRFQLLSRATNDVIWDWDLVNGSVWWNEGLYTLFGYRPDEMEPGAASWTNRIHPEDKDTVLASIQAIIDGNGSTWEHEYRFMHASGKPLAVIDRGFVIRDETGKALRMLGSMLDDTERREMADRLRESQKLEAVGQLTGGVAHDFNNLLTVILGNAELLCEQLADRQQLRLLAEMTATAAQRGAELTNRLLAFARRQALEPRFIDINRLISGMENLLRRTLTEDIDIKIVRADGLWRVEVDPGQLEMAMLNLALNGRDAMPEGGHLTVETANAMLDSEYAANHVDVLPGPYAMVSVSDTGLGMTPDVAKRAFEPFFTTKQLGQGSGLGLSMVYGFVKQSGGHAMIYSEPGLGTTIRLYFPRVRTNGEDIYEKPLASTVIGGNEHILVVEDDNLVRDHVTGLLRSLGYRITAAASGPDALDVLQQTPDIDLLFTDVVMPGGMNGGQLAELARNTRPGLKVLFTSGYTENAIVHHGRLDRGVHLLGKPYRRQELAAKVRKVLDERSDA
ncbi:MAG: PAS domain S-box protein [Aquisalimonadaceae bacterium]